MTEADHQDIRVPDLYNQLVQHYASIAIQQSNSIVVAGKVANATLKTGEKYLHRILSYLIDRSIESSKNSKITLNCVCKDLPEKTITVLQVVDSATSLDAAQIARIMDTGHSSNASATNDESDDKFDINMVYVRTFSALLGGKLYVFSEPERGTTFSITFIHDNTPEPEVTETSSSGIDFF
jgi:K+-sensing histidine kinase KdpD